MIPDPGADLFAFLEKFVGAITAKNWPLVLGCVVLAVVFVARKYGGLLPKVGPVIESFLKSDPGGVVLAFLVSFGLTVAASPALSWAVLGASCKVAFAAMGGFVALKKGLVPLLKWLVAKFWPSSQAVPAPVPVPASGAEAAKLALKP